MSTSSTEGPPICGRNGATTVFIILSSITFVIATVLVSLRAYVRLKVLRSWWWDDTTITIAYLILVPYFALLWRMTDRGLGYDTRCVPRADLVFDLDLEDITEFMFIICSMFARSSVAFFVGRLFGVTHRVRMLLYGYTAFMCVSMIVTAVLTWTVCYPVKAYWDVQPGNITNCTSQTGQNFRNYYNGAVGILSDFILASLPAYFLHKLRLPRKIRLILTALMGCGLVPAGCCLARTIVMSEMSIDQPLKGFAKVVLFAAIEMSTLIICACLPVLRPLYSRKFWRNGPSVVSASRFHPLIPDNNQHGIDLITVVREFDMRSALRNPVPLSIRAFTGGRIKLSSNKSEPVMADGDQN